MRTMVLRPVGVATESPLEAAGPMSSSLKTKSGSLYSTMAAKTKICQQDFRQTLKVLFSFPFLYTLGFCSSNLK